MSKVEKIKTQIKNGTYNWDAAINNLAEVMVSMMANTNPSINNKGDKND